jgi:hypothetical protein
VPYEAGQLQGKLSEIPHSRHHSNMPSADLLFGFKPITASIAFPSGVPALQKNLVRPVADLLVRTDA